MFAEETGRALKRHERTRSDLSHEHVVVGQVKAGGRLNFWWRLERFVAVAMDGESAAWGYLAGRWRRRWQTRTYRLENIW